MILERNSSAVEGGEFAFRLRPAAVVRSRADHVRRLEESVACSKAPQSTIDPGCLYVTVIAVTVLLHPLLFKTNSTHCERKYHTNIPYRIRRDPSALVELENSLLRIIHPSRRNPWQSTVVSLVWVVSNHDQTRLPQDD